MELGRCLVTACKREDMDIITVVLGADTKKIRTTDSIKLIEYANKNFEVVNVKEIIVDRFEKWKEEYGSRINVYKGITNRVDLALSNIKYNKIALSKLEKENFEIEINNIFDIEAPIRMNYKLGEMNIKINQETIDILDIITREEVKRKGVKDYFYEILGLVY